jgi:2-oxoglutarate ferredoxin oxidoreductase subunit alpha
MEPAEAPSRIDIALAGQTGDGIITIGDVLAKALMRRGLRVFTFRYYPTEVRLGPVTYFASAVNARIPLEGDGLDVLVGFDQDGLERGLPSLREGGVTIVDADRVTPTVGPGISPVPVAATSIAKARHVLTRNAVLLGALAKVLGLEEEALLPLLERRFADDPGVAEANREAFREGAASVPHAMVEMPAAAQTGEENVLLSGNEAVSLGAIAAGCRFFAGYPITPASEILEFLAAELPAFGGSVMQVEDEMAALGSVLGASFTGAKAMTATSGPGFSLMSELLGLSSMAEIPCVVVDCQRGGPSTGVPTRTEQSDLLEAVHGTHGEGPRVVLAPASVADCFSTTVDAFNLAEMYQLPVVVLSDLYLAHRKESVPMPDVSRIALVNRLLAPEADLVDFRRYAMTDDGISPAALPGGPGAHPEMGIEHDELGLPDYTPATRKAMMEKRFRKLHSLAYERAADVLSEEGGVGVLAWGSTAGAVAAALDEIHRRGEESRGMILRQLHPLPEDRLREFAKGLRAVVIPELNFTAQLASMARSALDVPVRSLTKYDGTPFRSGEIVATVEEVMASG